MDNLHNKLITIQPNKCKGHKSIRMIEITSPRGSNEDKIIVPLSSSNKNRCKCLFFFKK